MKHVKIPVVINLLALARYNNMPAYPIQMMTRGSLSFPDGPGLLLEYKESLEDDDNGEVTTSDVALNIEENQVIMFRNGECMNTMVFDRKHRFEGTYHTPFGDMDMAVDTREVSCNMGIEHGRVFLRYLLHFNGNYASTNELHLEYFSEASVLRQEETENDENIAQ